jgi:hypothetical protein
MKYQVSSTQQDSYSLITPEQMHQVMAAVTDGRYSWACVLFLRFIGHNPLHFIPQRTYSRLLRENSQGHAN